eukprot:CAMPEP_0177580958 /NCGR_PEP_ID=MMETSP0419_2-20121207/1869_1 /TAXON_ID=582737 /ORGANISM="Tetraselmis sp., Strain GSL018" /LENGTH=900 /DNA_ID=CAMNT_0019069923 /DNA_START=788 /DNA_END=3491 /DNA_ORIENTATION=+
MEALFFGRIDKQDLSFRKRTKELEMLWMAGESFTDDGDCFTGVFYSGNYGAPEGFNWDHGSWDPPMQDDPRLEGYNVEERLKAFADQVDKIAAMHRGDDIMLTMGMDFQYMNANHNFKNMDKLIHHMNSHPEYSKRYRVFYSTPEDYVAAKHAYNMSWPRKRGDFFPYSDCDHCFWAGYFTSKPASKRYARAASSYLQAARQLEAAVGRGSSGATTDALEEAVSLMQHHDAITGTAKKHVVNDYHKRLAAGWAEARQVVASAAAQLIPAGLCAAQAVASRGVLQASARASRRMGADAPPPRAQVLGECPLINSSICELSVRRTDAGGAGFDVAMYNPLGRARTARIRVPIGSAESVAVTDERGRAVKAQIVPLPRETLRLQDQETAQGRAIREVAFQAELRPLAFAVFTVRPASPADPDAAAPSTVRRVADNGSGAVRLDNGRLVLELDARRGTVARLENTAEGLGTALTHGLLWYRSSSGDEEEDPGQASGAYIFRPDAVFNVSETGSIDLEIIDGPVVQEARQRHSSWASVTHRLWRGWHHMEAEWTVGPIPTSDGFGREVVSRWGTELSTDGRFWTDANGREMMPRDLDKRETWTLDVKEPVAGNFYPVTSAAFVRDLAKPAEFYVLTDRAQAATSLSSGQLEFMIHRRTTTDDRRGVGEPLDETTCDCHDCDCPVRVGLTVRGTHILGLEHPQRSSAARRSAQQDLNDPPLMVFAEAGALSSPSSPATPWAGALPSNVHLLTLLETERGALLLRLAHLYEAGEAGSLGSPACVDIGELLGDSVSAVRELSLTGTPRRDPQARRRFGSRRLSPVNATEAEIECSGKRWPEVLMPMQIRTWEVRLGGANQDMLRAAEGPALPNSEPRIHATVLADFIPSQGPMLLPWYLPYAWPAWCS